MTMVDTYPRIVAVDFGTRRVGLAKTDPLRMFSQPVGTFSQDEAINQIRLIEDQDGLETIVVGWPLLENGEEGKATKRVEPYLRRLAKVFPACSLVKQDERYSSRRAAEALVQAGLKRKARGEKGRLDSTAAMLILQDYLEEHSA